VHLSDGLCVVPYGMVAESSFSSGKSQATLRRVLRVTCARVDPGGIEGGHDAGLPDMLLGSCRSMSFDAVSDPTFLLRRRLWLQPQSRAAGYAFRYSPVLSLYTASD